MEQQNYKQGLLYALACAIIWGFLPIYWDALDAINAFVIILHRIVLMMVACFIICYYKQRNIKEIFRPMFESRKKMWTYIFAGIVITINWSIYIWSVTNGFVIQSSMGYFLEPLIVCLFAMVIYKEKLNKWKIIALSLALTGLFVMIIGYKEVPLIALGLASSFGVYSAIKKSVDLPAFQSLLFESLFLVPIALVAVIWLESNDMGALAMGGIGTFGLLMFAGIATAVPLGLFSAAAKKLPLFTLGLTEYISPSISLLLGIFLFKEAFDMIQFSAFALVWIGLVFFSYGEICDIREK